MCSFNIVFQFHASAGICPNTAEAVREVVAQNKTFKKEHVLVRLQESMMSKLETDKSTVSLYNLQVQNRQLIIGQNMVSKIW